MPDYTLANWTLPVNFYFLVDFQNKLDHFQASFTEVSGLDIKLGAHKKSNDTGIWIKMPAEVEYGNITFKRLAAPLIKKDTFTEWVNKCLKTDKDKRIIPYDVIIKILDGEGNPLIGWKCSHAYPIQWTPSGLDAGKSGLATETVVLTCNRIDRIM